MRRLGRSRLSEGLYSKSIPGRRMANATAATGRPRRLIPLQVLPIRVFYSHRSLRKLKQHLCLLASIEDERASSEDTTTAKPQELDANLDEGNRKKLRSQQIHNYRTLRCTKLSQGTSLTSMYAARPFRPNTHPDPSRSYLLSHLHLMFRDVHCDWLAQPRYG